MIIIGALVVSVACWRALDEVARDAHKTAWYWGGSFGMLAAFIAFVAAKKLGLEPLLVAGRGPLDLIELGLIGVIIAQLIGYLVVWAGWWFVRR
ncbi:hypothetical protein [Phenylobacterium sp. J367]|uniref:hypothetical protein n=1 Tax=Phenylobacterium sp. J367 TaxID=2898435 RepID=UPI002150E11D|nr:hypothetical protein [Phenylobacterium sp. J367]MCR5878698.1 hypothetical protein [Phenylobacterium sp. J367]